MSESINENILLLLPTFPFLSLGPLKKYTKLYTFLNFIYINKVIKENSFHDTNLKHFTYAVIDRTVDKHRSYRIERWNMHKSLCITITVVVKNLIPMLLSVIPIVGYFWENLGWALRSS